MSFMWTRCKAEVFNVHIDNEMTDRTEENRVRQAEWRERDRQKKLANPPKEGLDARLLKRFTDENGDIDYEAYMKHMLPIVLVDLTNTGKGIPSKKTEMFLKLMGILNDKKESAPKHEYSPNEIARDSEQFIEFLREEFEKTCAACPVCGKPNILLAEIRDN